MRSEGHAAVCHLLESDDAVGVGGLVGSEIVLRRHRRRVNLTKICAELHQGHRDLPALWCRLGRQPRHERVPACIHEEVPADVPIDRADLQSSASTGLRVVLVDHVAEVPERVHESSTHAHGDQRFWNPEQVFPAVCCEAQPPKVAAPDGEFRSVLILAFLVHRREVE